MAVLDIPKLHAELEAAPDWALFTENHNAAARGLSVHQVRLERRRGTGVPFTKEGKRVLYSKRAILDYIEQMRIAGLPWHEQFDQILPASWHSKLEPVCITGILKGIPLADAYFEIAREYMDSCIAANDRVGVKSVDAH